MTPKFQTYSSGQFLVFAIVGLLACGDEQAGTSPGETTSGTSTQTTALVESESGSSTSAPDTTGGEDALAPWYGVWYSLHPTLSVNTPVTWENGGAGLAVTHVELHTKGATIKDKSCLWGWSREFEYTTVVGEDGRTELQPVGGVHEYPSAGAIERLIVQPGEDCSALVLVEVDAQGEERDFFGSAAAPLARGRLCLDECPKQPQEWGVITDCGTPVPWSCSEGG